MDLSIESCQDSPTPKTTEKALRATCDPNLCLANRGKLLLIAFAISILVSFDN